MRLFVLSPDSRSDGSPSGSRTQLIGNRAWSLVELDLRPNPDGHGADFVCVSYSWGLGRTPSAFHPSSLVSDRTEGAVAAVVEQRPACRSIWVDAFCVPSEEEHPAERAATLESMGFIYAQAAEVIVVLTAQARPAIEQLARKHKLLPAHLDLLEQEDWVTRAWTYQEAVNARHLSLTCENAPRGTIVSCSDFLSSLGHALVALHPDERAASYPRLDAFEDVMGDWAVAGYLERSALQVMAIMDRRTQTRPEDHFYAMIGALSAEPAGMKPLQQQQLASPCEAFMALCEREGDYSFIFASVKRDMTMPGRWWRPVAGPELPAIIRLSSWGGLRGRFEDGCLTLEDVVVLRPAPALPHLAVFIEEFVVGFRPDGAYAGLEPGEAAFKVLQELGFSGTSEYVATEYGLFFPWERLPRRDGVEILVAVGLRWSLGAAAIARYAKSSESDDVVSCYEPGVFFGTMVDLVGSPVTVRLV
ncbi:hypothetical protein C8A01DRAFT_14091 [Parachaetomium inaequale]|uniref:Heterokaryon incompatibility domain-containing protein n=1 Tax=Parachaetomium inaequale TaxID=2588326 RepID=A0AAN6PJS4_9PEZI|nr:hypothetical protein C8A01DRAFT_14091 [Parachaetomium inaequale]